MSLIARKLAMVGVSVLMAGVFMLWIMPFEVQVESGMDPWGWIKDAAYSVFPLAIAAIGWLVTVGRKSIDLSHWNVLDAVSDLFGEMSDNAEERRARKRKEEQARLASVVVEPYAPHAVQHQSAVPAVSPAAVDRKKPSAKPFRAASLWGAPAPETTPLVASPTEVEEPAESNPAEAKPLLSALELARKGISRRKTSQIRVDPMEKFAAQIEAQKERLNQLR